MISTGEIAQIGIAEEIHDGPLQLFSAAAMRVDLLIGSMESGQTDALELSWKLLSDGIDGLRAILERHYIDQGADEGLQACLGRAGMPFQSRTALSIDLSGLVVEPVGELSRLVRRIGREAIVNAYKHANAQIIAVTMVSERGGIHVQVDDDGVGFEHIEGSEGIGHLGLRSSQDQAEMSGGWWRLSSAPGEGTQVQFWLPDRVATAS